MHQANLCTLVSVCFMSQTKIIVKVFGPFFFRSLPCVCVCVRARARFSSCALEPIHHFIIYIYTHTDQHESRTCTRNARILCNILSWHFISQPHYHNSGVKNRTMKKTYTHTRARALSNQPHTLTSTFELCHIFSAMCFAIMTGKFICWMHK